MEVTTRKISKSEVKKLYNKLTKKKKEKKVMALGNIIS